MTLKMYGFMLGAILYAGAGDAQNTGTLTLHFEPQFGGQALALGHRQYRTAQGDSLYLDLFRFYVSALQLQGRGAGFLEKDSSRLFDAEAPASQTIVLKNIPPGRYKALIFNVGTDSLTNVAGALGGDLDPTRGMYWAWNTGYINIKIEGRSPACRTRRHAFEFHIGGYRQPYPSLRQVVLPLRRLRIAAGKTRTLRVQVDLAAFFNQIQLAHTNQVMIPGKAAARLADHFKGIFSLK